MVIMRVLVVDLLCHVVIGQIPALESLLLGTRGRMWLYLVLFGIKRPRYPRFLALRSHARY
jgi:hypothetical protein